MKKHNLYTVLKMRDTGNEVGSFPPSKLFITTFQVVTFSHVFKCINFYVTFLIVTCYLALSISLLLLFFFLPLISYFPYFKFVTFKTRVILCNTLKKEGRAFRNIGKYIPILFNQPC